MCPGPMPRDCVPCSIPDLLAPLSPSGLQLQVNVPAISPQREIGIQ